MKIAPLSLVALPPAASPSDRVDECGVVVLRG